jgi:outer membrane protein OmpA-like peptidoglycan-associated protein
VEGAGKREPLYPGDDAETWRLNRRVEFVLSK